MEQLDLFGEHTNSEPTPIPAAFRAAPARAETKPPLRPAPPTTSTVCDAPAAKPSASGIRPIPRKPHYPARRYNGSDFGEAIADAWYGAHGSSRMDIPVGIVAALALWPHKSPGASHARLIGDFIADRPAAQLPAGLGEVVAHHWLERPDLIDVAAPIFRWTEEAHDASTLRAIKAVTNAAIKHGVLWHTGDVDPGARSHVDLMSWTITNLRHRSSRSGLGEYHTPPEVCDLIARVTLDLEQMPAGGWINEPAGGTGGMFRAAAGLMRDMGREPRDYRWMLQELDPIAAAGAAVNMLVWDLGPRALVACGNTLAEGNLATAALKHQAAVFAHRDRMVAAAATAAALRRVEELIGMASEERQPA